MEDSLKTVLVGSTSAATISLGGIITIIYLGIKIYKLIKE